MASWRILERDKIESKERGIYVSAKKDVLKHTCVSEVACCVHDVVLCSKSYLHVGGLSMGCVHILVRAMNSKAGCNDCSIAVGYGKIMQLAPRYPIRQDPFGLRSERGF
jgi:hypothetical protein